MARAGLGPGWKCLFSNDIDEKKAISYRKNWVEADAGSAFLCLDVAKLKSAELPGHADLAWASFPCQDLSLAGNGAGLKGERSGTFWPFWRLVKQLGAEQRKPRIIVLENVCGALTSHNGADFRSLIHALQSENYRAGALVINASYFVPQSRPRLFIVGVDSSLQIDENLLSDYPASVFHTESVVRAYKKLSPAAKKQWMWWNLPAPKEPVQVLADVISDQSGQWNSQEATARLLAMMSPANLSKVNAAMQTGLRVVGAVYKRTRPTEEGTRQQRAEVRFDDLAGCLRTPGGGSSRQTVLIIKGKSVRSRLISAREAATLMGLPKSYKLPERYNDAYHLLGDGVVVPVVRHLACYLLEPLLKKNAAEPERAA